MRLTATQAKVTQRYINSTRDYILNSLKVGQFDFGMIQSKLSGLPNEALKLINELAQYEAEFSYSKMKKLPGVKALSSFEVTNIVENIKVKTSLNSLKNTLKNIYTHFADAKAKQFIQMVRDYQVDNTIDLKAKVIEASKGLFATQNMSLAKLSVVAIANAIRNRLIINANSR